MCSEQRAAAVSDWRVLLLQTDKHKMRGFFFQLKPKTCTKSKSAPKERLLPEGVGPEAGPR